jgi:hypothetical protein
MFKKLTEVDNEAVLVIDGMHEALIGECTTWDNGSRVTRLIYDAAIIINVLMERDKMSYFDAKDYIAFNIEDAYMGRTTPIIMWPCEMLEVDLSGDDSGTAH